MSQEICKDHHVCRNGSRCMEHPDIPGSYTCDCEAAEEIYAGLSCDHQASSFCNAENMRNSDSFCTNGGVCIEDTDNLGVHYGCVCPTGYMGDFCELTEGQTVPDYVSASKRSAAADEGTNTGLVAGLSAAAVIVVMASLVGMFIFVKRRNGTVHSTLSPKSIREADSTQLEADGEVLRNSVASGELYSAASNVSQKSHSRKKLDTQVDMTEGVESVDEDV